jgi:crossover junction endodeoxyribonuclease RuvC
MGYGIILIKNKKAHLISLGVINMKKFSNHYVKLKHIFERVTGLIDEYKPDELAIEAPFYGKNIQSMLKLGRAQGAAIAAALQREIPITEYAPRKIKLAITGSGSASKEQVAGLLKNILKIKELPKDLNDIEGASDIISDLVKNQQRLEEQIQLYNVGMLAIMDMIDKLNKDLEYLKKKINNDEIK